MLPLRFARRWRTASIVLLILVLIATLMPASWFVPEKKIIAGWLGETDKILHAVTFLLLALWFAGQYRPRSYWRIAIGLLAFGAFIEISQSTVAYRSAEWFDMLANGVGIGVGLTIALIGAGGWCLRFENRFASVKAGPGGD